MENTARFCRFGIGSTFWDISDENYRLFLELDKQYEKIYRPNDDETWLEQSALKSRRDHAGLIAIVFAATYIESEAYTYIASHTSDSFARQHLDKLDHSPSG